MIDKFFAELVGTFVFLAVIITSGHATLRSKEALSWLKIGLALSISILLVGFISGAHLNPAVSWMLYINNDINVESLVVVTFYSPLVVLVVDIISLFLITAFIF